jgi:AcrR family transcriptional regulator
VPRLWTDTIETHRREVRDAILETTVQLVREHGLLSVTMSQIAERSGIGRATLYKYFPDVEAILLTWHDRHVEGHLRQLTELHDGSGTTMQRLEAVLGTYARICHYRARHGIEELTALLHRHEHVTTAELAVHHMFRDLVAEGVATGDIRDDVDPEELAWYCLHAATAASDLPAEAIPRLVAVTLAGLRPG